MSDSLRPHGLQPTRLLWSGDFPDKSTGVGCHFFLQGLFPTQGSNPPVSCVSCTSGEAFTTAPLGSPKVTVNPTQNWLKQSGNSMMSQNSKSKGQLAVAALHCPPPSTPMPTLPRLPGSGLKVAASWFTLTARSKDCPPTTSGKKRPCFPSEGQFRMLWGSEGRGAQSWLLVRITWRVKNKNEETLCRPYGHGVLSSTTAPFPPSQ